VSFELPKLSPQDRHRLAGALREASEHGRPAQILQNEINILIANAPQSFYVATKARKLLAAIARMTKAPGEWVKLHDATDQSLAYAAHVGELIYLTDYIREQSWAEKNRSGTGDTMDMRLTPAGWEEVQRRPRIESAQGFVAMWFDPSIYDTYEHGIKAAIELDCGYRARRIDFKEFNADVVFEIMAEIRESRFLVADLTNQNNGVYFEAGFARGLDVPVIWTCRKDDAHNIHFDASHDKQIRWEAPDEIRIALAARIKGTIGHGPLK
jgi:hypothetical protein